MGKLTRSTKKQKNIAILIAVIATFITALVVPLPFFGTFLYLLSPNTWLNALLFVVIAFIIAFCLISTAKYRQDVYTRSFGFLCALIMFTIAFVLIALYFGGYFR